MINYKEDLQNRYFEWLYNYVCKGKVNNKISYKKIFMLLYDIDFDFYLYEDVNRAMDGIDLRNRFAIEIGNEEASDILDTPCSVLEMMVALAVKCEETIMDDPRYGDRTSQWFWSMMTNLGLNRMTDDVYNERYATNKIYIFLERQYEPNGQGGLFYIKDCKDDLRNVDIWTQLCWYLDTFV